MEHLIVRSLQGRASEAEERRLKLWREASASNEAAFLQAERLWNLTEHARPVGPTQPRLRTRTRWGRIASRVLAAAALVVLGFGIAKVWSVRASLSVAQFATGESEMVTATLSDGSLVQLAPNSRLRFVSGEDGRTVWLEGQAFFAVAENEAKPFVVRTRLGEATVLGTRFDVRVDEEEMRLVVVEGKVRVVASDVEADVGRGELSRVQSGGALTVERVDNMYAYLEWMGGTVVFRSTPLAEALDEIEHRYGRSIQLVDSALAGRSVTAWFTNRPFEEVVTAVCRVVEATCTIGETQATVGR